MNFSKKNHEHKNKNVIDVSKKVILSVAVIAALGLTSCKNETKKEKALIEVLIYYVEINPNWRYT